MQDKQSEIKPRQKILYAITKGIWGGAQEYVYTLATSLPKEMYDVVVVCGEGNELPKKLQEKNIRVIHIQSLSRDISLCAEIKSFWKLWRIVQKEKPDVLHLNSSKMGLLGGIVGRISGVQKIIFTAHGWAFNESRSWMSKKCFVLLQWLTILLSDRTIAVSEKTKRDVASFPYILKKISIIYNGIGHIDFLDKETARQKITSNVNTKPTDILIGTISELHKNKGLDLLVSACQNLPANVSVYIIGNGEEKENLSGQIKKLHLEKKVFLVGRLENARIYLKAFDIFTLTSRTEALPYVLLEAGLAECAVIASRVGGIPEIVENQKSGLLVETGNISDIEKSLSDLISDVNKINFLGENLKQTIEQKFSLETMIEKTLKSYS